MQEILKHIILALTILNLPMYGLAKFSSGAGSAASALMIGALVLYYFFVKKSKPIWPLLLLGLAYFSLSGLNYSGLTDQYIKDGLKYFLFILSITEVAKHTTTTEACFYLLIGSASIIINALLFSDDYGRYAGFYLNPNRAALVCILGFAYSYGLANKKHKLIAQVICTLAGLATLSRSFILLFILINVISLFANKRNVIGLLAGAVGLVIIINTPAFELNNDRFSALESIFNDDAVNTSVITRETRDETWAMYTDAILDNMFIGNGYGALQGYISGPLGFDVGVHNTYLMVLGESGIIPFLIIFIFYSSLVVKSFKHFSTHPEYLYFSIIASSFLMVSHNYFYNYVILFFTVWIYTRVSMENPVKIE